jgi:CDP-2,3-bis-(O-geranylgeranyl)-sn-glycerol synthase
MQHFIDAFWFFLPAGIANMTPPLANKIPGLKNWKTPLDFGKRWRGKQLFGSNKTWRGVITGMVMAGLVAMLQYSFGPHAITSSSLIISALLGMIMGVGALLGDAVESFFKRQIGIKPGNSWFPFDQLDYIVGGLLAIYPFVRPPFILMIWIVGVYFGLHLIVSYIGYLLKFKDKPI